MSCPYRFGIYEKAMAPKDLPQLFVQAAKAGFQTFEISLDETDERLDRLNWPDDKLKIIRDAANQEGVQLFSACLSGHRKYALGSADPNTVRQAMEIMNKAIEFACKLGIRVLQITGSDVFYEPHSPDTEKRYIANLALGVEYAAQYGVMLAIEPVEDYITSIHKAMDIVNRIQSPWLQVYPDVANLAAMGFDPITELGYCTQHIVGLHIRDAQAGTSYNIPWGSGIVDFIAVFRKLSQMHFTAPIIIEFWHEDGFDDFQRIYASKAFLLDRFEKTLQIQEN